MSRDRVKTAFALVGLLIVSPLQAATVSSDSQIATRFFNVIPDVCFRSARGNPPTSENAHALLLEPSPEVPPTVTSHYGRITSWYRLQSQPDSIFIGVTGQSNACVVVLANTTQTIQVQSTVINLLKAGGFQVLSENTAADSDTDVIFAKKAPDGYMLVSLQAPRNVLRGGDGDQGAVHVNLMPTETFESMLTKH